MADDQTLPKGEEDATSEQDWSSVASTSSPSPENEIPGSSSDQPRPDILFCLTLKQSDQDYLFWKDTPWDGIDDGLPGPGSDDGAESESDSDATRAVFVWHVQADVHDYDKSEKKPNTAQNWRENPVDIEFGRDAEQIWRYWPSIEIYSKNLIKIIESMLDYYPTRYNMNYFDSAIEDTIVEIMYCYAEMKHYLGIYRQNLPRDEQSDPKYIIGSCGDEKIADLIQSDLNFGGFDRYSHPCDDATAYDLAVLLRHIRGMYRTKVVPTLNSIYLDTRPVISHESLWILFRPGTIVYLKERQESHESRRHSRPSIAQGSDDNENAYSACVVESWEYNDADDDSTNDVAQWKLNLWHVLYDGTDFKRVARQTTIDEYKKTMPLKDLPVIPASLYDRFDNGALKHRLEKRGEKYLSIIKEPAAQRMYHQRNGYEGLVIIDPDAYRQHSGETREYEPVNDSGGGERFQGLTDCDPANCEDFARIKELSLLLPPWIEGFGLKTKKWMIFQVESITSEAPVALRSQLDDELVLVSDSDKDVLRTVLPRGQHALGSTPDFVAGKGEGKIFLLYGGPGTGKTLTVECLAHDTGRPLLSLTAQDVGLVQDVESQMRTFFNLAAKWDAILLIDEADLFLEQRREGDLERNSLSTVFLRTMEYYRGILFLTTNRPGHIDDSFISRITCPIAYPDLSSETKAKIVQKFVDRFEETGTVIFHQAAAAHLIRNCEGLNGRQLRNVLQNAVAAAENKMRADQRPAAGNTRGNPMVNVEVRHIKTAVERHTGFQEYLRELRGRDERSRARSKQSYLPIPPGSPGRY